MRIHAVMDAVLVLKHIRPKNTFESFLRFLQVKYGILTVLRHRVDSVVVGACVSRFSGSIHCNCSGMFRDEEDSRCSHVFLLLQNLAFELGFGQRCHPAR